jgi:hypothetical protein
MLGYAGQAPRLCGLPGIDLVAKKQVLERRSHMVQAPFDFA